MNTTTQAACKKLTIWELYIWANRQILNIYLKLVAKDVVNTIYL